MCGEQLGGKGQEQVLSLGEGEKEILPFFQKLTLSKKSQAEKGTSRKDRKKITKKPL